MGLNLKNAVKVAAFITLTVSMGAHANDNGHCLGLYQNAEHKLFEQQQSKRRDMSAMTAPLLAGSLFAGYGAFRGSKLITGVFGLAAAAGWYAGYATKQDAERLTNEYASKVFEYKMIFTTYQDLAQDGQIDTPEAKNFSQQLEADPAREAAIMREFVAEMESGALCDGDKIKPIGAIFADLKKRDAETASAIY